MKIAVIGAGSFVFSTGLLYDLIAEYRMSGQQIVLMDLDREMAETMAGIARRLASEHDVEIAVAATGDRAEALAGADFVVTSVAAQMVARWHRDKEILHRHGIPEITSECGGVGGLSYTLRQAALLLDIAREMETRCPRAWLLNVSNPLPRVVTAVTHFTGIRALGFCNVATGGVGGYQNVAGLLRRDVRDLNVTSGGLNHFAWLLGVQDRWTGEDLLPAVQAALEQSDWSPSPLTYKWWKQYGYYPLAGDSHTGEYLPIDPADITEHTAYHGDAEERAARRRALQAMAAGGGAWHTLLHGRAWERPAEVIHALITGTRRRLDVVNLPNRGAIDGLPDDAVVEVPAIVADGTVTGVRLGAMPDALAGIIARVSQVHTLAATAAYTGKWADVEAVIECDPAITEKIAARAAVKEMIAVNADVLPAFSVATA